MDLENEIWKDIEGYEGIYQISNFGNVKNLSRKKTRKPKICRGYVGIILSKIGKMKNLSIHRLIAKAFIPNPENKPQINHINGIKTDNRIENLEWVTGSENMIHAYANNITKAANGENHGLSKLTEQKVKEIRNIAADKKYSFKEIAKIFRVNPSNISLIVNRKRWKHVNAIN